MGRTFAIGDIHGDRAHLDRVLERLPQAQSGDTIVFVGDYVDRGPDSKGVVELVRRLQRDSAAKVVALRGNHEDAWVRSIDQGWSEFVLSPANGCLATMRSYTGRPQPGPDDLPAADEVDALFTGAFFPPDVIEWMRALPLWHEDDHAIYVHAGVASDGTRWLHPSEVHPPATILWTRSREMFRGYRGKTLIIGHTMTRFLPPEISTYTPADPTDLWVGNDIVALDTGCGKGGFLTAVELPARRVYESR